MGYEVHVRKTRTLELARVDPRDPAPDEVRVAVQRCGICGSDLHYFRGRQQAPQVCIGHEMSGVVDAVGSPDSGWTPGDRIVIEPLARCRSCAHCKAGDYHLCKGLQIYGVMRPGGMASSVVVPDYCLYRLPDSVDFEMGALAEPIAVSVHALRLANVGHDSRVLILGAGTIGLLTAVAARHLGAETVAITARYPQQRKIAQQLGCDEVLDPEGVPSIKAPPNVVIETVGGDASTVSDGICAVEAGGIVVITGLFEDTPKFDPLIMMVKEARLVASMVYNRAGDRSDFDIALEILGEQSEALKPLVSHVFPLEQAQRAFETACDKSTGAIKVLLDPTSAR